MFQGLLQSLDGLSYLGSKTCSFPRCTQTSQENFMSCAACGIVNYCSKACQKADWKRHKSLCMGCRPFKEYSKCMTLRQNTALDEYSKIKLPPVNEEYRRRYGADAALYIWLTTGLSVTQDMLSTNILNLSKEESDERDQLKRWQELSPALFDFIYKAKPGDIFLQKQYHPYQPQASQQFRNTPLAEPIKLESGRTLVDIGFVDFGIAFDSIKTLDPGEEPLVIVGYDASPQCVAKSLVMVEMMSDADVEARSIVEVWLSSLWSDKTFVAFRRATSNLLDPNAQDTIHNKKVRSILKVWNKIPRASKQAALNFQRNGVFSESRATNVMNACALESESDRVEYLHYIVTKALYDDDSTVVGSPLMGKHSEKQGMKQIFESCIEAVPFKVHASMDSCDSFMGRIKTYFEESVQAFATHVRSGALKFTPKVGIVDPGNVSLTQEIKKLNPFIVHWSNVADYIPPHEFHTIAKDISGSDTVHVLHSCNWTSWVYGTDVYDINPLVRLHFYSGGLAHSQMCATMMRGVIDLAPKHFRTLCSVLLTRKYVKKFLQYFFHNEEVSCGCTDGNTPLKSVCPFLRSDETIHFFFAYKSTGITFRGDTYDYMEDDD